MTESHPLTIAVTGGAGFIGSAVRREAERRGHRVVAIDASHNAIPDGGIHAVDIRDRESLSTLLMAERPDVVVHAAAVVGVDSVDRDLLTATAVNVLGAVTVFECARSAGARRVVDVSSEEIYGASNSGMPIREDAPLVPTTNYGVHKLAIELLGRGFEQRGLDYAAARLSWVYGHGFPRSRPPQVWIEDAGAGVVSAPAAGADHLVDLLHVEDAARALVALAEAPALARSAYNVGSGVAVSLGDIAVAVQKLAPHWNVSLSAGPLPGIANRGALAITNINEELSWWPDVSLEEGLRRTLHGR